MRYVLAVVLCFFMMSATSVTAWANSSNQLREQAKSTKSDLDSLGRELRSAQQKLTLSQRERTKQQKTLNEAERQIQQINRSLATTRENMRKSRERIAELKAEQNKLRSAREAQLKQLKVDIKQSYRAGKNDYFKLLLNQENPALLSRQLRYYSYIHKARSERISELDSSLLVLAALEQEEAAQTKTLEELTQRLAGEEDQLKEAQAKRAKALAVLSSEIRTQDKTVRDLRRNQANLQSLMRRLERQAREQERLERERVRREAERRAKEAAASGREAPKPPPEKPAEPSWGQAPDYSEAYRGACPLPVSGNIRAQFGADRGGGLRWNGLVIDARPGTQVKAVKAGKVMYADYLRGYGNLVIIDHGKGFMSLYGYNRSIQVKVNEQISAGANIALVGDASGEAGLYFETRVRGRPSQPGNWCNY